VNVIWVNLDKGPLNGFLFWLH